MTVAPLPLALRLCLHPEFGTDCHAERKANQISQQPLSEKIAVPLGWLRAQEGGSGKERHWNGLRMVRKKKGFSEPPLVLLLTLQLESVSLLLRG